MITASIFKKNIWAQNALAKRFLIGGAWNLFGNAASQILNLAAQIVVARWLGQVGFGQLGMVYGTVGMLGIVASLGLGLTATKHVAEFCVSEPARAGRIIRLTLLVTLIAAGAVTALVAVGSQWIATYIMKAPELAFPLRTGCFLIMLGSINTLQIAILAGFECFRQVAAINLGKGLCSVPGLLIGAWFGHVTGVLIAYTVIALIFCGMAQWAVRREVKRRGLNLKPIGLKSELALLWSFSAPAYLNSLLWPLSVWGTNLLVIRLPGGYQKLALLNAVRQWQAAANFIPIALNGAIMPILASVLTNTPKDKDYSLQLATRLTYIAVWPVTLALMLGAPFLLALYGPGFSSALPVFVVLMGATGVNLLNSSAGSLMLAKGAMFASVINSLLTSLFTILVIALTISRWELQSVSVVTLICNIISTIGIVYYANSTLHFPSSVGRGIIISAIVMAGITILMGLLFSIFLP